MNENNKLWRSITGQSTRTAHSIRRQREQYEQHVRNGNDAVRNNPNQR